MAIEACAPPAPAFVTPQDGLSEDDVAERVGDGRTNAFAPRTSRTVAAIVRTNVFTFFNGLLLVLFLVIVATGRWQNGLFGGVIVANSVIGIVSELRAKRTLDHLRVITTPTARVVRAARVQDIDVRAVVLDDLMEMRSGDQIPVDGTVTEATSLEIDESMLTGESTAIFKNFGEQVLSGSIVVAGHGHAQVTAVGATTFAARLAVEATRSTVTHSELVAGTDRLLKWISLVMLVAAPVLLISQLHSPDNVGWQDAVTGTVAALVGLIPEGLVLLTSLAFMVATVSLARHQTLVQELPAVEVLARVDVVCLDKTGTLTYGNLAVDDTHMLGTATDLDVHNALALLSNDADANATSEALSTQFTNSTWNAVAEIAFSSARKWSAVTTGDHGTWVLGAPEIVLPEPIGAEQCATRSRADGIAATGRRVLLLATTRTGLTPHTNLLPTGLQPAALVVLAERVREDAAETLRYFCTEGVALKVISGDNPRTVGAVASRVGIPDVQSAEDAIDARTLPTNLDLLGKILDGSSAFGRISPQQKRDVVNALQQQGHVVAMTGDGVNDTLALEAADVGVAMGNGSAASRAVAQIVLLDGKFSHLPDVVAQGRRVTANIERAANLFLVKNMYSLVLAAITIAMSSAYPLAPIQLTLISTLTIGVPGFVLALLPNQRRYVPGFLYRVLHFAVPTGIIVGFAAYAGFWLTRYLDSSAGVEGGRTTATLSVLVVSLWTVCVLARPLALSTIALIAAVTAIIVLIVAVPVLATNIFLLYPTLPRIGLALAIGVIASALVEASSRIGRRMHPAVRTQGDSSTGRGAVRMDRCGRE